MDSHTHAHRTRTAHSPTPYVIQSFIRSTFPSNLHSTPLDSIPLHFHIPCQQIHIPHHPPSPPLIATSLSISMADNTQAKAKANASFQDYETLSSTDNSRLEKQAETAAEASDASTTATATTTTTTTTRRGIENNENVNKAVLSTTTTPEFSSSTSLGDQAQQGHGQQPNSLLESIDSVERTLRGSSSEDDTSEWTTIEHASIPQHGDLAQGRQDQPLNKTSSNTSSSLFTTIPPPSASFNNNDHQDQGIDMRTHNPLLLNTTPSPVSTNPFRQSSASPHLSSSSSPLSQQTEQLPGVTANVSLSEDPFSLSTNQTTEPDTTGPLTRVISGGVTGYPTDGVAAVPMGLPPPYLPSPQLASASTSPPAVISASSLSAPAALSPSSSVPSANPTPPQEKAEYVLKPIDWIDPATGIEKRVKIITQNGMKRKQRKQKPHPCFGEHVERKKNKATPTFCINAIYRNLHLFSILY